MIANLHAVAGTCAQLGESPVWDSAAECLYWVDIDRHEIHRYVEGDGDRLVATLDVPVGAVAPRSGGGLIIAAGRGFASLDKDGDLRWLAQVDRGDRMNDAAVDPRGRFLAGTMMRDRSPGAALYRLDPDGTVTTLLTDVALSNGLGWSPDGSRLYYVDTVTRRVDVFDYDLATGTPSGRRPFVEFGDTPGNPDGLTVDSDGGVWVVMARGSSVRRFTADGELDRVLDLPVSRATGCTLGGPALSTLYITTGRFDLDEEQLRAEPLTGALLGLPVDATGLPSTPFAG